MKKYDENMLPGTVDGSFYCGRECHLLDLESCYDIYQCVKKFHLKVYIIILINNRLGESQFFPTYTNTQNTRRHRKARISR